MQEMFLNVWKGLNIFCYWTEGVESIPTARWSDMNGVNPTEISGRHL